MSAFVETNDFWKPLCFNKPRGCAYVCSCRTPEDQERYLRTSRLVMRAVRKAQALWRGYTTRKNLAKRNEKEVRAMEPLWHYLDDTYRMCVFCQTLNCKLKKSDPEFDATKTPYYIWMLEHSRQIEEMETYLQRRGWVRPKNEDDEDDEGSSGWGDEEQAEGTLALFDTVE